VFLDGDCKTGVGCQVLPGIDAPERAVFNAMKEQGWKDIWTRIKRSEPDVSSACEAAMNLGDHHDWIDYAAKQLAIGSNVLWHAMCGEWAERCLSNSDVRSIEKYIEDRLLEYR